jgi:predicted MPP superfamily phosphohydrolase
LFGAVLLLAAALLHGYVFARAATVPLLRRFVSPRAAAAAALLAFVAFLAAFRYGHGTPGGSAALLERCSLDWLSLLFLCASTLLAVDLATLFGRLLPRRAPALRGAALAAALLLSAFASRLGASPPVVESFEVRLPELPPELDGTVVTALSDLHLGEQLGPSWLAARVEQVRRTRPDLVVLLGDVFEGHGRPRAALVEGLRALSAPMGVYAVTGNHESHGGGGDGAAALAQAGIRVLRDERVEVRKGLVLAGVDDLTARRRRGGGSGGDPVRKVLEGRPPGGAVLLSHTPWEAETAARAGAGLMLSGHTHGGQVWPFGLLVRLVYPLSDGEYDVDGMKAIVSRGAGTWGARMRLFRPSQIVRVTLRSAPPRPSPTPSRSPL